MHRDQFEKEWQEEGVQTPLMSMSQSYALEQVKEDLLSVGHRDHSTACDLPETTPSRQQASTSAQSLDHDEYLPGKLSSTHAYGTLGAPAEQETVLYLAYGSNLASATFLGVRGIRPLSQLGVVVPGLRLTFDLPGIPYLEPCFAGTHFRSASADANTDHSPGAYSFEKHDLLQPPGNDQDRYTGPLVGIVYEVTISDYARIIATEGGGRGYKDIVMTCYPFPETYDPSDPIPERPGTQPLKAHTLLSPLALQSKTKTPGRPRRAQPSARYLNLITTGAGEHNLPLAYREYLAQVQPYRITSIRQKVGMVLFMMTWAPLLLTSLGLARIFAGSDGRSPHWVGLLHDFVSTGMWSSYDNVFVHIFGDGERTVER